jgi:hypothetical protein
MRFLTGGATSAIATRTGLEPIVFVVIFWGGGTYWFASKAGTGARPTIISLGDCVNEKRAAHKGSTGAASVTFDDSDGFLKSVIDTILTEKAAAQVLLGFEGYSSHDLILLLNGKVVGPVSYSEGERTLTLTVEPQVESQEAGFSPSDEFPDLAPEAIGVPWPMLFGTVEHSPCPIVRKHVEGFLKAPIRLNSSIYKVSSDGQSITISEDCTVSTFLGDDSADSTIYIRGGNDFHQGSEIKIIVDGVVFKGRFDGETFTVTGANLPRYENVTFASRSGLSFDDNYHARVPAKTYLSGMYIYMGKSSNYVSKQEGDVVELRHISLNPTTHDPLPLGPSQTIDKAYVIMKNGAVGATASLLEDLIDSIQSGYKETSKARIGALKYFFDQMQGQSDIFWQAPADTSVRLFDKADPDIYIVSCVQCASVDAVYGHKSVTYADGTTRKVLAPIPTDYYDVQLSSNYPVNGVNVTGLIFNTPLKDFEDEGWDDKVFASATSTIGPNVADIIEFILNTYVPDLNTIGFNQAGGHTDDANFAYRQRRNALDLASDIAWQAKCALRTDSNTAELIYLAIQPGTVLNLGEGNTELGSLKLSFTPTTQIKTKLVARWSETDKDKTQPGPYNELRAQRLINTIYSIIESDSSSRRMDEHVEVYRENIDVFGLLEDQVDIFIFNNADSIDSTLQFWGHRYANSWRTVELVTFLNGAALQSFDNVLLNYASPELWNLVNVQGEVESTSLNFKEKTVSLKLWLPIIAGQISAVPSKVWPG